MKKTIFCLLGFVLHFIGGHSQTIDTSRFFYNLDVLVVPTVTGDQTIEQLFQEQLLYRDMIGLIQNQLLESDLKVVDFSSKYQKYQDQVKRMGEPAGRTTLQVFLDVASPDVFVELDVKEEQCPGGQHKVNISLKTFLTATNTLVNRQVFSSNCFAGNTNVKQLLSSGIKMHKVFPAYVQEMKKRLLQQVKFGQPLELHININNNYFSFNSLVQLPEGDEMALFEAIEKWLFEHLEIEFDGSSNGLDTDRTWVVGEVTIPVVDEATSKPYPLYKITSGFKNYLNRIKFTEPSAPKKISISNRKVQSTIYFLLE